MTVGPTRATHTATTAQRPSVRTAVVMNVHGERGSNALTDSSGVRIGVDVGGTFTDVVLSFDRSIMYTAKVMTTYADLVDAIRTGIDLCAQSLPEAVLDAGPSQSTNAWLLHGTTLVSNAYIERKSTPISLICTQGFKDILDFPEIQRFDIWDLNLTYPPKLVEPEDIMEISERINFQGEEVAKVDRDALPGIAEKLKSSVAVALLNSYANPDHEQLLREELGRLRPDVDISLSSDVSREAGEYSRTLTTVANALVKSIIVPYLTRLELEAKARLGEQSKFMMMLSNGGLCSAKVAQSLPVRIVESGPAAGVTAAHAYVGTLDLPTATQGKSASQFISLDMGGTTAKIAFIEAGSPLQLASNIEVARDRRHRAGSGMALLVPSIDLVEIGAGGSSIAKRDELGLIEVGPESASSEPGPAAYGRGGTRPTVTDANIVLGYLPAWQQLGGIAKVHKDLAHHAVLTLLEEEVATDGTAQAEGVALGIHRIANEKMAGAIRVAAAERGLQPDDHTLFAFGGAAPLHACGVAAQLGIDTVVIPPEPGVFSSVGLVLAPQKLESVRSFNRQLPLPRAERDAALSLVHEMRKELSGLIEGRQVTWTVLADLRFVRQHHVLTVDLGDSLPSNEGILAAFRAEYTHLYRRTLDAPVELVNVRLVGLGEAPDVKVDLSHMSHQPSTAQTTVATFLTSRATGPARGEEGQQIPVPVVPRNGDLNRGEGPTLITEDHTTTVVPPDWSWARTGNGAIVIRKLGI